MTSPTDKAGITCILGMIIFLAVHIPNVSTITVPHEACLNQTHFSLGDPDQAKPLIK